ncbi:MAG TPA: hypothetical protein VEY07_05550 [Thermoplasmata archaeon]|nr:hypothetical protein [Thermoplasmata archaeon]
MDERRATSTRRTVIAAVAVLAVVGTLASVFAVGVAAARVTCNISVNTENSANTSVQSAINSANPGWTICLGAGSFPEQLTIATSGLTLRGAGSGLTSIDPASVVSNTVDWDSSFPQQALDTVVLVDNTTGVSLTNLAVVGTAAASSISGCSPGFVGIDYQNSSGTVSGVAVRGIELAPSLLGCQSQLGIYAYTGFFSTSFVPSPALKVTVTKTVVTSYGKNGITCNDPGLTCVLTSDTTTGIGGTSAIAQNGIQIGFGAVGQLTGNHVSADNYTGGGSTLDWFGTGTQGAGILLYNPGSATTVFKSVVSQSPFAIAEYETAASSVYITGNTITGATGYAIVVNGAPGTTALIANNTVNQLATGAPGILVDNGTFNVSKNVISHTSATGTNGASQVVCGTGSYLSCATTLSIRTAAIQAVSEGAGGPTDVTLFANTFSHDNLSMATVALPTGSVTTQWT